MANEEDLRLLNSGIIPWNGSRVMLPDLSVADLSGRVFIDEQSLAGNYDYYGGSYEYASRAPVYADFRRTNFCGSSLNSSNLYKANLSEATFNIVQHEVDKLVDKFN